MSFKNDKYKYFANYAQKPEASNVQIQIKNQNIENTITLGPQSSDNDFLDDKEIICEQTIDSCPKRKSRNQIMPIQNENQEDQVDYNDDEDDEDNDKYHSSKRTDQKSQGDKDSLNYSPNAQNDEQIELKINQQNNKLGTNLVNNNSKQSPIQVQIPLQNPFSQTTIQLNNYNSQNNITINNQHTTNMGTLPGYSNRVRGKTVTILQDSTELYNTDPEQGLVFQKTEVIMKKWIAKIFFIFILQIVLANAFIISGFSMGKKYFFVYVSTPFMGIASGCMIHCIMGYHPYSLKNFNPKKQTGIFVVFSCIAYGISYLWGYMFVFKKWIPMTSYYFPLLSVIIYVLYGIFFLLFNCSKSMKTKVMIRNSKNQDLEKVDILDLRLYDTSEQKIVSVQDMAMDKPEEKNKRSTILFTLGIVIICSMSIGQVCFSMNLLVIFRQVLNESQHFLFLVCGIFYPVIVGLLFICQEQIAERMYLGLVWELFFLDHIGASIPYRLLYFEIVENELMGVILIVVKILFKFFTYVIVPLNYEKLLFIKKLAIKFLTFGLKEDEMKSFNPKVKKNITEKFFVLQYTDIVNQVTIFIIVIVIKYAFHLENSPITALSDGAVKVLAFQAIIETLADLGLLFLFTNILDCHQQQQETNRESSYQQEQQNPQEHIKYIDINGGWNPDPKFPILTTVRETNDIDRVPFRENHILEERPTKPLIFTPKERYPMRPGLDQILPHLQKSTFLENFAQREVDLRPAVSEPQGVVPQILKDYLEGFGKQDNSNLQSLLTSKSEEVLYLFGMNQWEFLEDYIPPQGIKPLISNTPNIGFGGSGSGAPFHKHSEVYNEVIYGQKIWFLSPPNKKPLFDESETSFRYFFDRKYENQGVSVVVQNAGEVLFVPEGWWHSTLNVGETVFIANFYPSG